MKPTIFTERVTNRRTMNATRLGFKEPKFVKSKPVRLKGECRYVTLPKEVALRGTSRLSDRKKKAQGVQALFGFARA